MRNKKLELFKNTISEKKGEDIEVYDISKFYPFASYAIVATINNGRHGKAISEALEEEQEKLGDRIKHLEGGEKDPWILIDLGEIIVHLFTQEERNRINIEDHFRKGIENAKKRS